MVCAACRNMLPYCRIIMLPFLLLPYAWAGTPTQLVVDLKPVPALGVSTSPMFRWAVAPCDDATDAMQTSYAITVTDAADTVIWDSGTVASPTALAAYGGAALNGSAGYAWTVTTTSDACGASAAATGSFVTAAAFAPNASFIWHSNSKAAFAFLRGEVPAVEGVARATLYASGLGDDFVLCSYKVWVAGELLGCGPGRGEAPMARDGTNATFRTGAYDTYDVTRFFGDGGAVAVAAQGVASKDAHPQVRGVLVQIDVVAGDGTTTSYATDGSWLAFDADAYLGPTLAKSWYKVRLENADARLEPAFGADAAAVRWRAAPLASLGGDWTAAAPAAAVGAVAPKLARPVRIVDAAATVGGHFFGDFGREFEGGLTFATAEGVDGVVLRVTTGESAANSTVGDAWGFVFNLTLRGGPMRYETHQYMEFRYVQVDVLAGSFDVATDLDVGAWTAEYPYDAAESSFDSSDATLDGVYELARWTVEAGVLDTFTDSNTRERRPYEADMLCAGTARLWVQRDAALLRHSVSYVLEAPTWPVEWLQMAPLLAWADYMATGETVVAETYADLLRNDTRYPADADATGLLSCSKPPNKCSSPPAGPGHHIVDWFPGPSGAMFRASDHLSVDQAFAVAGLRKLAATAGGAVAKAAAADADALYAAMKTHMWNASANRYCDGACADVAGHAGVTTAAWFLYNGLLEPAAAATACADVKAWGLEGFGSYGAFIYLSALAACDVDDGSAMLEALTKCDAQSCGRRGARASSPRPVAVRG
ncbi:hypothetical protein JL722_10351 [Aureococcus anophagefferens]|nr:hypothetical protein JL722_10351 [Aureococcus anophagefferens]